MGNREETEAHWPWACHKQISNSEIRLWLLLTEGCRGGRSDQADELGRPLQKTMTEGTQTRLAATETIRPGWTGESSEGGSAVKADGRKGKEGINNDV